MRFDMVTNDKRGAPAFSGEPREPNRDKALHSSPPLKSTVFGLALGQSEVQPPSKNYVTVVAPDAALP
jgi:hypothetical protein